MKKIILLLSVFLVLIVAGCEEKSLQSQKEEHRPESPGKITVVSGSQTELSAKEDKFRTFDVRGESIIKYAPDGAEVTQEVKNVQVNVAVRNTPFASIQTRLLSQRLSKEYIVFCSACHDDYANGVIGPSLIDKNEQEVLDMMVKYGKEPDANVLMTTLVERMSPEEKSFIARDIARFNKEIHSQKGSSERPEEEFHSNYK